MLRAARLGRKAVVVAVAGVAIALAVPTAASAHVHITPNTAEPGAMHLRLSFELHGAEAAGTDRIVVHLPTDAPFQTAACAPVPGWTAEVADGELPKPVKTSTMGTLTDAPLTITWTADEGHSVAASDLTEFPVLLGPVPDTGKVAFTVDQHYSDGHSVTWSPTSRDEPAPVLYVNDPPPASPDTMPAMTMTVGPATGGETSDPTARFVAWVAFGGWSATTVAAVVFVGIRKWRNARSGRGAEG